MIDDAYLNGYVKHLGPTASMIYICLCRHADKEQIAFPSQESIASKLGINPRVVMRKIVDLQKWGLVLKDRTRTSSGKWLHNTYYLLDKSEWKRPPTQKVHLDKPPTQKVPKPPTQNMYIKDTHIKDTHTLSIAKVSSLKEISEEEQTRIAELYQVPMAFVRSKYDDLINYCERTGRKYRNYVPALRNFVKQDAIKLRRENLYVNTKRGIDATRV